jgi:hypothetical protein
MKNVGETVIARSEAILNPALDGRGDLIIRYSNHEILRLLRFARNDIKTTFSTSHSARETPSA